MIGAWLRDHRRAAAGACREMARQPLASAAAALAIAVALALPAALLGVAAPLQAFAERWREGAGITVYLEPELTDAQAARLGERLLAWPEVAAVEVVGKRQALADYQRAMGIAGTATLVDPQTLPAILELRVHGGDERGVARVQRRLEALSGVALVQSGALWLHRLRAVARLATSAAWVLGVVMGIGALAVVASSVRAALAQAAAELELRLLLGATASQVRRPALYLGAGLGLLGGLLAGGLLAIGAWWLRPALSELAASYGNFGEPAGVSWTTAPALAAVGLGLGWLAARLGAQRQLRRAEGAAGGS